MPRANFVNYRSAVEQHNTAIAEFCLLHNMSEDYFIKQDLSVHPVVVSATRKAIILKPFVATFLDDLVSCMRYMSNERRHYSNYTVQLRYPVIWDKDKKGVIVFPNLLLDSCSRNTVSTLSDENPWVPVHLATVSNIIKNDLEHTERRAAWTPISRGVKRLGKRQSMSLSRALARAVVYKGKPIEDAQLIDNLAQKMQEIYAPAEFRFADTVSEMRDMYRREHDETPHSCMDSRHRFSFSDGTRPVDFYGYCPDSRGAYISKGNTVLARTILWRDDTTGLWSHSRIYSTRSVHHEELENHLNKHDVKSINQRRCRVRTQFTIPLCTQGGATSIPMPYMDAQPFDALGVKINEKDGCFAVYIGRSRKTGWQYPPLQSTGGGYIPSSVSHCTNCDTDINTDDDYFIRVGADMYCSDECAFDLDVVQYCTSGAEEYMYERDVDWYNVVRSPFNPNYVFSNHQAGVNRGHMFLAVPWADTEEAMFINPNHHNFRRYRREYYSFDHKTETPMSMYSYMTYNMSGIKNDLWGGSGFLTVPCEGTLDPNIPRVKEWPLAYNVNEVPFTDDMFDNYIGDVLNTPAPYYYGVLINHPTE